MTYVLLNMMHVLGVSMFLGTLLVNFRIKQAAEKSEDAAQLRFAYLTIRRNDMTTTTLGAVLVLIAGLGMAGLLGKNAAQTWLFVALGLSVVAFLAWMVGMVPAQKKLNLATEEAGEERPDTAALSGRWNVAWSVTIIMSLAAMMLMYGKDKIL